MTDRNVLKVADWLELGEEPVDAGLAQSVDFAETQGSVRGAGEGVLVLTDRRLIFRDDETRRGITVPLEDVEQARDSWIVIPGMRSLKVKARGRSREFEFYVGKAWAKTLVAMLR